MKNVFIAIAFIITGSLAHAKPVYMGVVKCTEHNSALKIKTQYTIFTDFDAENLDIKNGKGIVVFDSGGFPISYEADVKVTGDDKNLSVQVTSESAPYVEVISLNFKDKVTGVRLITNKNDSNAPARSTLLQCESLL